MVRLYKYVIENYFILTALFGFLGMLSIHYFEYGNIITLSLFIVGFSSFVREKNSLIDYVLMLTILIISLLGFFLCPYKLLYKVGFTAEIIPMFAFFVGRSKLCNDEKIFKKGIYALTITSLMGLWLYITQPSWYINYRLTNIENVTDNSFLEMTRLSAFWEYPYWISYGSAIIYSFILGQLVIEHRYPKRLGFFLLFFFALISLLTQQRASMGIIVLTTVVYNIYSRKIDNRSYRGILKAIIVMSFALLFLYLFMSKYIDETRLDFMLKKFTDINESDNNFLKDRADIFDNMRDVPISLLGDGLGLYSHTADSMGLKHYITDQGYMKMLYETGVFGFLFRVGAITCCFIRGLKYRRIFYFELTIIFMIMVSLFGANSLSSMQMHNVIFWLCCGRIYNRKLLETKRQEILNNNILYAK